MRTLLTLLLLSSVAFGAQIREQTYTPVGKSAIPQMTFVPLEPGPLPDDCLTNGAVFGIPVTVKLTNGLLSTPPLNGGRYDVDIGIYGKKFRVLIPPCDTNTYSLRDVVDYATNTSYSVIYQYLAPTNTFATKAELLSTSNVLYSSSGGTGGAATNVIWPVAGTNMSAVTNLLTVSLSAEVSRGYVDSKASAGTNEAQRVGSASTNLSYALGAAGTNEALRVGSGATSEVARASLASTNFSLSIGAAATNEAARIGGLATNEALRVSQASTNESFRLAALNTNDALRVSQNATSEVARASAVMTNHVNMVSNAISGQIGGGVVNAAIQATNDSTGQNIATQFGNGTNHALLIGSRATNEATRVSQNATSEVARVSATLQYGTSALTNLSAGNGSALTGIVAAGRATNDSTGQSIAVQFGNITNHVTLTTNAFASATNSLVLNNNYQLLSTWTPASVTNIGGTSATASMWSSLIVSNASASNITLRVDAANVRALGPSTTNALIIAAGKVGLLSVQTFGQLITNYATASQQ